MNRPLLAGLAVAALLVASPASAQLDRYDDADLKRKIEQKLAVSAALGDDRLTVSVFEGVATVSGVVDTLYESWQARNLVAGITGIVAYESRLQLEPRVIPDASLAAAVRRAVDDRVLPGPTTGSIEVSVAAEGVVTLGGKLRDGRRRLDARAAAAKVEGVREIVDRIETPKATDEEIEKRLASQLAGGTLAPIEGHVEVLVEDGVVTLSGTTPRLSEAMAAEERALGVNGVLGVVNEIVVERPTGRVKVIRP